MNGYFPGVTGRSVAIWMWLLATVARADGRTATDDLDRIAALVMHAEHDQAQSALESYLEQPALSAAERNRALELMAVLRIAERNMEQAMETLHVLFRRDPGHVLSDVDPSPLLASVFANARRGVAGTVDVALTHEPASVRHGSAYPVPIAIGAGLDAVHAVAVEYWLGDDVMTARILLAPREDGTVTGHIALPNHGAHGVRYWVEALAPSGAVLARVGAPSAPLRAIVPASPTLEPGWAHRATPTWRPADRDGPRVVRTWWFWTLVGVAATSTAASIGLAATR
jgi:hypothetical protein